MDHGFKRLTNKENDESQEKVKKKRLSFTYKKLNVVILNKKNLYVFFPWNYLKSSDKNI